MNSAYNFKRRVILSLVVMVSLMGIFGFLGTFPLYAETAESASPKPVDNNNFKWGFIAAAIAFGFGALGAGIAIANVGAAAMGAIGEKPEIASQALIFIALAEGLVVFGFITALMILGKL